MRPPEIEERIIPGHWEGDLIKGSRGKSVVGTLVERSTLFVTLAKIRDATADAAVAGFSHVLKRIDAQRRPSLTHDHDADGRSSAPHKDHWRQGAAPIRTAHGSAYHRKHQWTAPAVPAQNADLPCSSSQN